ncbi:MAG TPA: YfhH family protein [Pseudoneobacillus sp.]|nr:YfhH family protein [Pseudoneobacillus sp.]
MQQDKRYSSMSEYELQQEISHLNEKARKAEQLGMVNEYAVLERKAIMAKAYLVDPSTIKENELYEIEGDPGTYFKVQYLNGVFAWGFRVGGNTDEEALPISMLKNIKK